MDSILDKTWSEINNCVPCIKTDGFGQKHCLCTEKTAEDQVLILVGCTNERFGNLDFYERVKSARASLLTVSLSVYPSLLSRTL